MNEIQIFQSDEFGRIRTVVIDGVTWFCGRDVAMALGYTDTSQAIRKHCKSKGVTKRYTPTDVTSRNDVSHSKTRKGQMMTYINEPNLYRLIIG